MIAEGLRDRLMSALTVATGHVNKGDDPTQAVYKAAAADDFNVEQTRRLCEMFNTARTLYHFERNPGQKEASFPLADQAEVVRLLMAAPADARGPRAAGLPDYSAYERPERIDFNSLPDGNYTSKAASAELGYPESAPDLPSLETQAGRVRAIVEGQLRWCKDAASVARQAEITTASRLTKLAEEVAYDADVYGPERYGRLRHVCLADPELAPMLPKFAEFLPHRLSSYAAPCKDYVVEDRDLSGWVTLLKEARDFTQRASQLTVAAAAMEKDALEFEQQFLQTAKLARPEEEGWLNQLFGDAPLKLAQDTTYSYKQPRFGVTELFSDPPADKDEAKAWREQHQTQVTRKTTPSVLGGLPEGARKGIGDAASSYISSGLQKVLDDGSTETANRKITERLRNHQRQVMLQELMTSDPFISEADPQAVANSYKVIMDVAPDVSMQKEVVRAVLRQAVQSTAFGAYDAAAIADLERTIREIRGTLPEKPRAAQSAPTGGKR